MLSKLTKARDLIQLGAYSAGHDSELDAAIRAQPRLVALLQQDMHERAPLDASRTQLAHALA
jgi:flagellum-specific ATP synthase